MPANVPTNSSFKSTTRLQIAIIGAGLGGLLLALCLEKDAPNVDINIFESASELTEVGAGIGMWPRMWEIIRHLGLEDELLDIAGAHNRVALPVHYCKADEKEQIEFYQLPPCLYTFHRSVLQKLLAKYLQTSDRIHFSKRLVTYEECRGDEPDDFFVLHFRDGTTATCNLLIGSDGIRSVVRTTMFRTLAEEAEQRESVEEALLFRSMVEPLWSGQVAYRGIIPTNKSTAWDANTPTILFGKDKHIVSYPISRGDAVNIAAFLNYPGQAGATYNGPWVSVTTGEEVSNKFSTWEPSIQAFMKHMEDPLCWAVHTVRDLPTYVKGRVVLIGDAAHAMEPHQGAGAGQALEDGFILAAILSHPFVTATNLPTALKIYDKVRRPVAQDVAHRSRTNGTLYQLNAMGWENVSEERSAAGGFPHQRLVEIGRAIEQAFDWTMLGSIFQDRGKAVAMVERLSRV